MKYMKRILSLLLVLAISLALTFTLISCGETDNDDNSNNNTNQNNNNNNDNNTDTDDKESYTVTVKDEDGAVVSGVKLMISDSATVFQNKTTDENGKATIDLDKANASLGVMITSVPDLYEKPAAVNGMYHAMFGNNKEVTITLEKATTETVTYTVKVIDQNGDAVVGASVQICYTVCLTCDPTDANGETTKDIDASISAETLKVKVLTAEGYTIPEGTIGDGYHAAFDAASTTVTITITKP